MAHRVADVTELTGPANLSAKFTQRVQEANVTASHLKGPVTPEERFTPGTVETDEEDEFFERIDSYAVASPRVAILESYIPLERAAAELVREFGAMPR